MSDLTVAGKLSCGIEFSGKVISDFAMRPATIADAIASIEKGGIDSSGLRLRLFKAAEQIVKIGDIPSEMITGELLLGLPESDIEAIFSAQDAVEKKQSCLKLS
jgi:hypothetical protein